MTLRIAARGVLICVCAGLLWPAHAEAQEQRSAQRVAFGGVVYYLDGAGGSGVFLNWGRPIRRGLEQAGFQGEFRNYNWQTGLGPLLDHTMGDNRKRARGRRLAEEIRQRLDSRPGEPVHLIGLSAGTAVLVHTLEALPQGYQVDNVVLLGSSVRSDFDMTRALRRVRGRMYVFSSEHDQVLRSLVPAVGTADRQFAGRSVAGLRGFAMPRGAGEETRRLYAKIVHVPWRPEFARYGHSGSHTGATDPAFVQHQVAPLLRDNRVATQPSGLADRRRDQTQR